jgi:hypothetical protein
VIAVMARPLRIQYAGARYHVMSRAIAARRFSTMMRIATEFSTTFAMPFAHKAQVVSYCCSVGPTGEVLELDAVWVWE